MDEVFALAIIRDVTREVEEHNLRLADEEHALDTQKRESLTLLAAGIAHDVNNVLSVVLNAVESAASGDGQKLDAHLGGIDVVRLFDAFRIASPDIPVVVVSGSSEEDISKMFGERVYSGFLGKPFTLDEIKQTLLKVCR